MRYSLDLAEFIITKKEMRKAVPAPNGLLFIFIYQLKFIFFLDLTRVEYKSIRHDMTKDDGIFQFTVFDL